MEQDRLQFVRNYIRNKDLYHGVNKMQKDITIAVGIPSLIPAIFSIFNPLFLLCLTACLAIGLPLIGFSQYRKHEIIKECNNGCLKEIPYKDFKRMLKSGELDNLIQKVRDEEQEKFNEEYRNAFIEFAKTHHYYNPKMNIHGDTEINLDKKDPCDLNNKEFD